jgi:hypothetical protein
MLKTLFKKKIIIDHEQELADWEKKGKPFPPPHIVKQKAIAEYATQSGTTTLVETGTYLGDMVEAQKNRFDKIYSIELSEKLHKKALKRFNGNHNITLLQGDSGTKIAEVVAELNTPAIFWLDGHYSGGITAKADKDCPVPEELHAIFNSTVDHIILIDDARLFDGTNDYPAIGQIQDIIQHYKKNYTIENKEDIIRLTPAKI